MKHPRAVGGTRPNDDHLLNFYPSTLAARGGWYLRFFLISVGATDKCRDKSRSVDRPLDDSSMDHSPPFFAKRRDRQRGRREPSIVGLSNAPTRHPRALSIGAFYQIDRAPHPKSIGQSSINHFSPALFRSVINIAPPNHGEIHLTSFQCQQSFNIRANLAGNSKYPNFRLGTTDRTNKQCDESNYHKESVFAHLILID